MKSELDVPTPVSFRKVKGARREPVIDLILFNRKVERK